MALQLLLSRLQESAYDGVHSSVISPEVPPGNVTKYKKRFTSKPIQIDGMLTNWKIYGEIDLLVSHEDGTSSIIDGKVSMKKDSESLIESYWTQLEAYVFAFENPFEGESVKIKSIGLLQWRIDDSLLLGSNQRAFSVQHRYIPVTRRPTEFQEFLKQFIGIIEGEFPDSGAGCETCQFLSKLGYEY